MQKYRPLYSQGEVSTPVMCSDVVVYPYQIYQARLAGADALKLLAPALPAKVGLARIRTVRWNSDWPRLLL